MTLSFDRTHGLRRFKADLPKHTPTVAFLQYSKSAQLPEGCTLSFLLACPQIKFKSIHDEETRKPQTLNLSLTKDNQLKGFILSVFAYLILVFIIAVPGHVGLFKQQYLSFGMR